MELTVYNISFTYKFVARFISGSKCHRQPFGHNRNFDYEIRKSAPVPVIDEKSLIETKFCHNCILSGYSVVEQKCITSFYL